MFMHCTQTTEDIKTFLLHMTAPCLSQIALKFGLRQSNHFLRKFYPNVTHLCWFQRRTHWLANCGQWLEWHHCRPPTTSPSPKWGLKCTTQDKLHVCCHLANMIYDNKMSFIYEWCHLSPNYFGPCYPRDAMLARVIAIATCLSVCHAPVLCQNEES